MTIAKASCLAAGVIASALASGDSRSQTTDGYHAIQVFPIVVDTASFTQKFHFRNPSTLPLTITTRYFPATGTTATAITCPDFVVAPGGVSTFNSLRGLCPALAAGSQFGFLHTTASNTKVAWYAGFSRVANPQGNGFAVESFAANTFTSATSVVNGIRRSAASGGTPAFQTNCFLGNLNEIAPVGTPPSTNIHYTLYSSASSVIASADVSLAPGQMVRLLDVFAIAPAGDYFDAYMKIEEQGAEEPGILAFCTVQDNTSFGADFRVAKQELSDTVFGPFGPVVGSQDSIALRDYRSRYDGRRAFSIAVGAHTDHLFYFRHPDWVQCQLENADPNILEPASSRFEMRLQDAAGNVIAGGNEALGFGPVYLGEKTDYANGMDSRYYLRVEDDEGFNAFKATEYRVHCLSGSGSSLGEIVVFKGAGDTF